MRPRVIAGGAAGVVLLLGGAAMLTVANAKSPDGGAFNETAWNAGSNCLSHQKTSPGSKYTSGAEADTGKVLRMMRYYTAHGDKAFCDGKPANSNDQAWAQLFTDLGGDPGKVRGIRGG
jgi:hypothetical protein